MFGESGVDIVSLKSKEVGTLYMYMCINVELDIIQHKYVIACVQSAHQIEVISVTEILYAFYFREPMQYMLILSYMYVLMVYCQGHTQTMC